MDTAAMARSICAEVLAIARSLEKGGSPRQAADDLRNVAAGLTLLADLLQRERPSPPAPPQRDSAS